MDFTSFVPIVEVRTRLTPTIRINTNGGKPSPLVKILAPTIVGRDANGGEIFTSAPYGLTPSGPMGGVVFFGAVVGVLAVAFLAGRWTA